MATLPSTRMLLRKRLAVQVLSLVVVLFLGMVFLQDDLFGPAQSIRLHDMKTQKPASLNGRLHGLARYGLNDKILLTRRCITPSWSPTIDRDTVANIPDDLLITTPTFVDISKYDQKSISSIPCEPLRLKVPLPFPNAEYPEFLFGVATTHQRLNESLEAWSHWLSRSKAKVVVVVTDKQYVDDDPERTQMESLMAHHGIDMTLTSRHGNNSDRALQQFFLLRDLAQNIEPSTRWIGIVDDDTFFPSLWPVRQILDKFDSSELLYLGALSEDFSAVKKWGVMGYGGAGIFLSVPLLLELDPWVDVCVQNTDATQGDVLLNECIKRHTRARLTIIPRLYQEDIMGDVTGFYEGGLNPLSLHHWKSWHHLPVADMARVGDVCGDCFLQRWRFGNTVLTNGFSVSIYEEGVLDDVKFEHTEGTWDHADDGTGRWDFSLGLLREKIDERFRKRMKLVGAEWLDSKTLRQIYVSRGNWREQPNKADETTTNLLRRSFQTADGDDYKARQDDLTDVPPYQRQNLRPQDEGDGLTKLEQYSKDSEGVRLDDLVRFKEEVPYRLGNKRDKGDKKGDLEDERKHRDFKRDLRNDEGEDAGWDEVLELLWVV
ncbi:hypothetical protein G7046_g9012 [Stylonectria norvegica]|nr:hypothetical protein G7046_g9012 [Stylonectria norvegica]